MIRDLRLQTWHRTLLFGSVGLISITAWLVLWRFGVTLHSSVHLHGAVSDTTLVLLFVGAWTVMTVAMMLPTSVPLIATFDTIAGQRPDRSLLVALVVVGYLVTWVLLGLVFYSASIIVQRLVVTSAWLQTHGYVGGRRAVPCSGPLSVQSAQIPLSRQMSIATQFRTRTLARAT